jgi:hypothetical protein
MERCVKKQSKRRSSNEQVYFVNDCLDGAMGSQDRNGLAVWLSAEVRLG